MNKRGIRRLGLTQIGILLLVGALAGILACAYMVGLSRFRLEREMRREIVRVLRDREAGRLHCDTSWRRGETMFACQVAEVRHAFVLRLIATEDGKFVARGIRRSDGSVHVSLPPVPVDAGNPWNFN